MALSDEGLRYCWTVCVVQLYSEEHQASRNQAVSQKGGTRFRLRVSCRGISLDVEDVKWVKMGKDWLPSLAEHQPVHLDSQV
jgi:hypothetical protein